MTTKTLQRRKFIGNGLKGLAGVMLLQHLPASVMAEYASGKVTMPLGFQTFPIRDLLSKDFAGTLKMMAGLGYRNVEMCSPSGYVDAGFKALVPLKAEETRHIIEDAGLVCPSCHFTFGELKNNLDDRIDYAKKLGMTQMVCSSFWLPKTATLQDYLKACDELNKIGEATKKAGLQMGYHNHEMEFAIIDNVLIYDAIMKELDGNLVKMQFQTEVINLGYKASDYFKKYPGRFISSHLSDWTADKKQVPIGQGIIDWKEFFATAKTAGLHNYFVEMDLNTYKDSAAYIKSL
ncbi:MAG: sugar phosphate isomerase/epimerase family protein [Flavisolibacter sp.]